jgi:hypothetical protein
VKVVLALALVCRCQSPQIGCVFVTVNSVNSVNILYFVPLGSVLCASLHGASNLQTTTFFTVESICNFASLIFVLSGLGISVSFLSFLAALVVSSPFGTLSLNSCHLTAV